jgi:mannose-1-phosphate guanylyltransferase
VYGDSIYEFSLREMIKEHDRLDAFISMALLSYKTRLKYGFIDVNGNNKVTTWNEKPEIKGLINIGCYVMEPEFIDLIPASNAYGMDDAVRKALDLKKLVNGFKIESGFIDIGDKKSYLQTYKKYVERLGKI